MPAVVRIGDELSTGHGCAGTTTIESSNQSTTNVYANGGILIDVVGAPTPYHILFHLIHLVEIIHHTLNAGSATVLMQWYFGGTNRR